jgi:glucosyl-3-phosphoglycerate synthase
MNAGTSADETGDPRAAVVAQAVAAKAAAGGLTVTLCFPCRNEAGTIGGLVAAARRELVDHSGLVDELVVLDDGSTDETAVIAAAGGATVVPIEQVHRRYGAGAGKGNALWASVAATHGDVMVWCDGDLETFEPSWVAALALPLLEDAQIHLVKPRYHRPTDSGGGGRTTELVARPLLSLVAPTLTVIQQPLAGETAARRTVLEALPFVQGWGVEIALLMDVAARYGVDAIAEVDLGIRRHRHQPLASLALQAAEVMATGLGRAGVDLGAHPSLVSSDLVRTPLQLTERPPLAQRTTP